MKQLSITIQGGQIVKTFFCIRRSWLLFPVLFCQDPIDPASTVIIIRSLVPGGVAEKDGRLLPGDRLMFVNDVNLENSSLEEAVQALKGAPSGTVKIGVAKPLPVRILISWIFFYICKQNGLCRFPFSIMCFYDWIMAVGTFHQHGYWLPDVKI